MGRIELEGQQKVVTAAGKQSSVRLITSEQFSRFNPDVLGLGDVSLRSTQTEALAAIFDLAGFTTFCSQVDPHLAVPEYLSQFLDWLFTELKTGFVKESTDEGEVLWSGLPFLAKYLGDGVLFLWDTWDMGGTEICNVVTSLWEICANYRLSFYHKIRKITTQPPEVLRCGVARGTVFSVGNGEDFVGPCINIASRLQKLSSLTFCLSRRGFDIEKCMPAETSAKYLLKSVALRGIGEDELVWVRKEEFVELNDEDKALFKTP